MTATFMKKSNAGRGVLEVGLIGLDHLGLVSTAGLAQLGSDVTAFDAQSGLIKNLEVGELPIFEPGLKQLLKTNKRRIKFSNDFDQAVKDKDYLFVSFDCSVDRMGRIDLGMVEITLKRLRAIINPRTTVVISSQLPLGSCQKFKDQFQIGRLIYFPENLKLGSAVSDFLTPDRIVIGSDDEQLLLKFERDFNFNCPILTMNFESAEMVKQALNSYLATSISFSNQIADLCEQVGANFSDVSKALKSDRRIGPLAYLNVGLGFGGGHLDRDLGSLIKTAGRVKVDVRLLQAVSGVNEARLAKFMILIKRIWPNLEGKQIGLLGLAYKKGTDNLEHSISIDLARLLNKKSAKVRGLDPLVKKVVHSMGFIKVCQDELTFFKHLDLVILMTECGQFREFDVDQLARMMNNRVLIDTKNFLEADLFLKNGFRVISLGDQERLNL